MADQKRTSPNNSLHPPSYNSIQHHSLPSDFTINMDLLRNIVPQLPPGPHPELTENRDQNAQQGSSINHHLAGLIQSLRSSHWISIVTALAFAGYHVGIPVFQVSKREELNPYEIFSKLCISLIPLTLIAAKSKEERQRPIIWMAFALSLGFLYFANRLLAFAEGPIYIGTIPLAFRS